MTTMKKFGLFCLLFFAVAFTATAASTPITLHGGFTTSLKLAGKNPRLFTKLYYDKELKHKIPKEKMLSFHEGDVVWLDEGEEANLAEARQWIAYAQKLLQTSDKTAVVKTNTSPAQPKIASAQNSITAATLPKATVKATASPAPAAPQQAAAKTSGSATRPSRRELLDPELYTFTILAADPAQKSSGDVKTFYQIVTLSAGLNILEAQAVNRNGYLHLYLKPVAQTLKESCIFYRWKNPKDSTTIIFAKGPWELICEPDPQPISSLLNRSQ